MLNVIILYFSSNSSSCAIGQDIVVDFGLLKV